MAKLPQFQNDDATLQLMQNKWAAILNPIISNPVTSNLVLKNISLSTGTNNIPHLLGRPLQGWVIVRKRASADIYDIQDNNQTPNLTLKLVSDGSTSVDILVY